jgi:hypothetical protein
VLTTLLSDLLLVFALGSEDYRDRARAESELAARGWDARVALQAGRRYDDPEVSRRCESLYGTALGALLATFEPMPCIDGAWFDVEGIWPDYWPHYSTVQYRARYDRLVPYLDRVGRDSFPWNNYREATRQWLWEEIEAGADLDRLHRMVNEMRWRDDVFLYKHWNSMPVEGPTDFAPDFP